jgi:hypothetical protein
MMLIKVASRAVMLSGVHNQLMSTFAEDDMSIVVNGRRINDVVLINVRDV